MGEDRIYIIAEAGVNHNGSLARAKRLVDASARAGADAVKFQTFRAGDLASASARKAGYQRRQTGARGTQLEMLKKLELDERAHRELKGRCRQMGIEFLSAPFDIESLFLLARRLRLRRLKIPSGEITNAPLLLEAARSGLPVILSTGMSTTDEVRTALGVLAFGYTHRAAAPSIKAFERAYGSKSGRRALAGRVALLHCTTEYPAPFDEVNLRAMETLRSEFSLPVGLSDHTPGTAVPVAAAALGAAMIEKHITLDKSLPGPDHRASLEPGEFKEMVDAVRQVERALGDGLKAPSPSETRNIEVVRKSIVASREISKGERLTGDNLAVKRPGGGISPLLYWEMIGRTSGRDYKTDEMVEP